ncbi:hypothetical protein ACFYXM_13035 [Streptomyces sp. NPDC002476]|uniref:hypothetical protein n=1 Tax=Streptomyces sp. NPDC002476 TaxID=3364648 RepID=UPI00367727FC
MVDRGPVAGGTTGAGEGDLLVSDKEPGPELDLALYSLGLWRELAALLLQEIEHEAKGGLAVAPDPGFARRPAPLRRKPGQGRRRSRRGGAGRPGRRVRPGPATSRAPSPASCTGGSRRAGREVVHSSSRARAWPGKILPWRSHCSGPPRLMAKRDIVRWALHVGGW